MTYLHTILETCLPFLAIFLVALTTDRKRGKTTP